MSADQYLIWSHQHNAWWKPGGWGYTTTLWEAGRFSRVEVNGQLRWTEHREYQPDGKPNEVFIAVPDLADVEAVAGRDAIQIARRILDLLGERVNQATADAIRQRDTEVGEAR